MKTPEANGAAPRSVPRTGRWYCDLLIEAARQFAPAACIACAAVALLASGCSSYKALDVEGFAQGVPVREEGGLIIAGNVEPGKDALVFYPGALVESRAYVPLARTIAERGTPVVIVPMPFDLAILGASRAMKALERWPQTPFLIGGHSLGGVAATSFALKHRDRIHGLVYFASYPTSDISGSGLPVLSVYATNDGLATLSDIDKSRAKLPADARFIPIEGGNHAGFGLYGPQKKDNAASIAAGEQWKLAADAVAEFADSLSIPQTRQ